MCLGGECDACEEGALCVGRFNLAVSCECLLPLFDMCVGCDVVCVCSSAWCAQDTCLISADTI